ncbi:MAG: sensor histidine kinase [Actinomycetota bacterium]
MSSPALRSNAPGIPVRRRVIALAIASIGLPIITFALTKLRGTLELPSDLLLYLSFVVGVAAVGGIWPALLSALGAFALANWYFIKPLHTFEIAKRGDLVALIVFVLVAGVVSALVDLAARRRADAEGGRVEAEGLAHLAGALAVEQDPLPALLEGFLSTFAMSAVAVIRSDRRGSWLIEANAGVPQIRSPEVATDRFTLRDGSLLITLGPRIARADASVLRAFLAVLEAAIEARRLRKEVQAAAEVAETSELRGSILAAVSHDLRTPLASVKAAVSSLRQQDVEWSPGETKEFLATIEEETDRLNMLIGNLLDMSRLQAQALRTVMRPVGLDEVVPKALAGLKDRARLIEIDVPESLPRVNADATLLERAIANIVDNANTWSPPARPVTVEASANGDATVELRVIDHGPGIPKGERARVFEPFQRLGDVRDPRDLSGIGLGFAVAKGFVEAMGGALSLQDTLGGGLTTVISLTVAS